MFNQSISWGNSSKYKTVSRLLTGHRLTINVSPHEIVFIFKINKMDKRPVAETKDRGGKFEQQGKKMLKRANPGQKSG